MHGKEQKKMKTKVGVLGLLRMLLMDSSKKISFSRCIRDGDLVIVYERHDTMKAVKVCENSVLQNRFGVFKHSDWIGKPFGSKVFSSKGGFVYLLAPTPELWTLVLSHRTQILYIADISFVIMYLEVVPGCLVLESGTGSGSLTTSLARAVAPKGHVYTFDFHEQRAASARLKLDSRSFSRNLIQADVFLALCCFHASLSQNYLGLWMLTNFIVRVHSDEILGSKDFRNEI
ncbi:hypothetical protein V6N11_024339 [Hibiscus sabdariffa]|uniref:tRNA (adenine(58)-N(1))-methyltransferase n=1 Tax=Hibiscus sabdariffa TaxID=183260 RepID=A0ABR1ZAM6_9ROSI